METQDVSVSEHARIDTIILLLLRNLHITLPCSSVAFQEEYLCEMYKSFVVGAPLSETCLILSTKNTPSFHQYKERWKKRVRIFMGTKRVPC